MKLTNEQIIKYAPAAMQTKQTFELWVAEKTAKHITNTAPVSSKYSFLSTADVIDEMADRGWHAVYAKQTALSPVGIHEIQFESPELVDMFPSTYGLVPRITFLNAHTGNFAARSYKLIHRQVCSNGLVVQVTEGYKKSPHLGKVSDRVNMMITDYIDSLKEVKGVVSSAINAPVHHKTAIAMVNRALVARQLNPQTVDHKEILSPKRDGDTDNNLWTVFNRIQESIIRGGFHINLANGDKPYQLIAEPISNPAKTAKINQALWSDMVEVLAKK